MRIPLLGFLRAGTEAPVSPLVRDLQAALGSANVLHAPEDLIGYEYDATIERRRPDAVVFPSTTEDVAAAVR